MFVVDLARSIPGLGIIPNKHKQDKFLGRRPEKAIVVKTGQFFTQTKGRKAGTESDDEI